MARKKYENEDTELEQAYEKLTGNTNPGGKYAKKGSGKKNACSMPCRKKRKALRLHLLPPSPRAVTTRIMPQPQIFLRPLQFSFVVWYNMAV